MQNPMEISEEVSSKTCGFSKYHKTTMEEIKIELHKVNLLTEYSGTVSIYLKKAITTELKTYIDNTIIRVIDVNENNLDHNLTYSLSYLRILRPKQIDINRSYFENDLLYNAYEYIEFLKSINIKFPYPELFILSGVKDLDNAYWNGSYLTFGNGTIYSNPLTSPAIVGHELTHAVIQNICNLHYFGQSGALNEAYADIVGVCFEFWLREKKSIGWELGNECYFDHHSMRSFVEPNSRGQPKYMYDIYYVDSNIFNSEDNGGVHINSGIINHLFYQMQLKMDRKIILNIFIKILNKLKYNSTFFDFKYQMLKYLNSKIVEDISHNNEYNSFIMMLHRAIY